MNTTTDHYVEYEDGWWSMQCAAPATAFCHAIYECDCEAVYGQRINADGKPEHSTAYDEWHTGHFDPSECHHKSWLDELGEELLHGSFRAPVIPDWDGDTYTYTFAQETK